MLLSSSQWHDIHGEMNVCVCERKEEVVKRERFREWDGAGSLCIWCVSPCPDALRCERTCLSGSENRCNSLRRIGLCHQVLFCLRMFLISFFLYPSFQAWHAFAVLEEECKLCCIFSLFSIPFLTILISLSPMLLLLHSQVSSRVRAGFVDAHAFWRDTVTDLIAERKRQAERDGDKGQHNTKTLFQKFCCYFWFPVFLCSWHITLY